VTIVNHLSLITLIGKVDGKHAEPVTEGAILMLRCYKHSGTHTVTSDNGKELAGRQQISRALGIDFYFVHPYPSWDRGTNENTTGLIRQFLPKGT
jgi:transposase, IS30 family